MQDATSNTTEHLTRRNADEVLRRIVARVLAGPEQLEAVLGETAEPLIAFRADRTIISANEVAERFFGYGRRELDGLSTDELVPPRLRQPDAPPMAINAEVIAVDLPALRRDGTELEVVWTFGSAPTRPEAIFVVLVRDKAALDRAVDALRSSEESLRLIIDGISDHAILLLDSEGRVKTWNGGASKIKGYEAAEIIGTDFSVFYPPEDRESGKPRRVLEGARLHGRFEDEGWRVRQDGSRYWANVVVSALRDQHGGLTGFVNVTRDLSAKRAAAENERRLQLEQVARAAADSERQRFQRALMQAPFPVAIFHGPNHVITVANQMMLDAWKRGPEIFGQPLFKALPEFADQKFPALLDGVFRTAQPYIGHEEPMHLPSGPGGLLEERFFTYQCGPLVDSTESVEGLIVCSFEVTTQVRSRNEAQAANRAKDEFLATMSHELRTPLNSILGWSTILRRSCPEKEKLARALEVIERNARAQERLIGDLLDVSRIISGKLKLSLERVALWDVVHASVDVVRPAAENKRVRLFVDVDPDLPALVADPARLQQVVWNLLINAVRFTPSGGRITITGERVESNVCLRVRDTGAGIAAEHIPHVFERFRQVDSTTTRAHGGLGLGLAIVRHIVEAHGGSVAANSDGAGKGATFTVQLPIRAVDMSAAEEPVERGAEPAESSRWPAANLANIRVLVVEDDRDSLELVREVLEAAGAEVIPVVSARDALNIARPVDVIVSDIGMPEMDGYAMMKRIRSRDVGADTPALALTAYARADDAEHARRAGYQEHLVKPVDPAKLVEAVSRWTLSRRPSR